MRILYFSDGFGKQTFIYNQVKSVSAWHEAMYVCLKFDKRENLHFPVVEIPFEESKWWNRVRLSLETRGWYLTLKNAAFGKALRWVVDDFKPDIIHCQFGYEALKLLDNYPLDAKTPLVITFRGYDASQKLRYGCYVRRLRAILARPNTYAIFVCEHLKKNLERSGIAVPRYLIHYSNTNVDFFQRQTREHPAEPFTFVQVSTFRAKKGHEYTLRAFAQLKQAQPERRFKLVFAGGEPDTERGHFLQKMANDLGIESAEIQWIGWVNPEQIRALLETAHAGILHSIIAGDGDEEGIPNALMEAMSMELPVVSTRHAGIPELVQDGVNGILVAERDVEAYARALEQISTWGYKPENRARVEALFSKNVHNRKLLDFYEQIAR